MVSGSSLKILSLDDGSCIIAMGIYVLARHISLIAWQRHGARATQLYVPKARVLQEICSHVFKVVAACTWWKEGYKLYAEQNCIQKTTC